MTRVAILFLASILGCLAAEPRKVVLVAGTQSHNPGDHEYKAGCYLLQKFLKENGVESVVVTGGWPEDESVLEGARAIVLYSDGGGAHPFLKGQRLARIGRLMQRGVGLALLHYAVEIPKDQGGREFLDWIGGFYDRPYSQNPFNDARLVQASPSHPISRGWKDFDLKDEWYYRIRFREGEKGVVPILTAMLPKDAPNRELLAWAVERADGGRGFGFTGLHPHSNWNVPEFRTLLVNAVLWTGKYPVPKGGARSTLTPEDLTKNLFSSVEPFRQ